MALVSKILESTLTAGSTTVTFTDADIPNSLIRVFSSNSDIIPESRNLSGNTLTVIYAAQSNNIDVAVEIVKQGLDIVDNVTSTDTDKALSANQGKVLKDAIDTTNGNLSDLATVVDNLDIPDNITDLDDVNITSIQDGQVIAWDAVSEKFVNVNQSGGGGLVESVLWQGSLTTEGSPVTLNDSIQNYHDIIVKWSAYSDGSAYQRTVVIPVSVIETGILYQFCDSVIRNTSQYGFITFGFNDNTKIQITQTTKVSSGVGSGVIIQKVIGRKW